MLFPFFLLLNVVLLVRPEDLVGELAGGKLYMVVMCACLALAAPGILQSLSPTSLQRDPVTFYVLAYYGATVASAVAPLGLSVASEVASDFGKVILFYLVANVALSSAERLKAYLNWLSLLIACVIGLGLLQYHEVVDIPALKQIVQGEEDAEGNRIEYLRLSSSGVFNDPNDLCLIIAVGIAIAAMQVIEQNSFIMRVFGVGLLCYFPYALLLTKSRGGLLAVATCSLSLFLSRFGWLKGLIAALMALPLLFVLAGGRQASVDTSSGTAQSRVQLWVEGLATLPSHPILGIGYGQYAEEVGLVAHNSYVHSFVETGLVGGTLFVGMFYSVLCGLTSARATPIDGEEHFDDDNQMDPLTLRPYVTAAFAGYCGGMFSLSRNYVIPTFLVLAIANSYLRLIHPTEQRTWLQMSFSTVLRVSLIGALVLGFFKLFCMATANYG